MKTYLMQIRIKNYNIFIENENNKWSGFEYDRDNKKVGTKIFIHSFYEKTIMLETNSDVFVDDVIKSLIKEYNGIGK